ncbi:hypothetical protein [Streptomyces albiflavescens]|uniref:hypothetical protein n=1 Tax=Streptomyces albiflavescens TaxID=1623582 RepID=UPI001664ABF6|nr:hypothetical protein [Streptomyces albiflavescens]
MQNTWSTTARQIVMLWIIALCALGAASSLTAASTGAGPASTTVVSPDEEDWH